MDHRLIDVKLTSQPASRAFVAKLIVSCCKISSVALRICMGIGATLPKYRELASSIGMQFKLTQEFPVGLERLWTALGRIEYVKQKYRSLGSRSLRILKFKVDTETIEIELDRKVPVAGDQLPVWARALSGREQAMRQHTRWRRADFTHVEADIDIRALSVPVSARGTGSVVELSSGQSRMSLHFDVTSTSPVLKSSVAQVFAQQVKHALVADHKFTVEYLRRNERQ